MNAISKTQYMQGCQCEKLLWLATNKGDVLEKEENIRTTEGNEVGELARTYFPGAVTVPLNRAGEMAKETARLIDAGNKVICEATFLANGLSCSADIIRIEGKAADLIEVKSSTSVKLRQLEDVTFQYHVVSEALKGFGLSVRNVFLMHPNGDYVRGDDLDIYAYFKMERVTDFVQKEAVNVEANLEKFMALCKGDEPEESLDMHCETPFECPAKAYCHAIHHIPEKSVFSMAGMTAKKKYDLYKMGIVTPRDMLHAPGALTGRQAIQAQAMAAGIDGKEMSRLQLDYKNLSAFLDTIQYPLYYLDFESFQKAIPPYKGTQPFQQIPFQYSLHIQQELGGELEHCEFLAVAGKDPRRALAEQLVHDIPMGEQSMAYNSSFEKTVCRKLAALFPDLADGLLSIVDNMIDLMIPFQKGWVTTPSMHGSYSIKAVLPALCGGDPALDYHALPVVHNGAQASETFGSLHLIKEYEKVEAIRKGLLLYCGLDTLAMVKVLEQLYVFAGGGVEYAAV